MAEKRKSENVEQRQVSESVVDKLWKIADASVYLRLSDKAVYGLVEVKGIPHIKIGSRVRFHPDTVRRWAYAKTIQTIENPNQTMIAQEVSDSTEGECTTLKSGRRCVSRQTPMKPKVK